MPSIFDNAYHALLSVVDEEPFSVEDLTHISSVLLFIRKDIQPRLPLDTRRKQVTTSLQPTANRVRACFTASYAYNASLSSVSDNSAVQRKHTFMPNAGKALPPNP